MLQHIIKSQRQKNNLSQKELAKLVGATCQSVCDWEHGRSNPNRKRLAKIVKLFNLTTRDLFEEDTESA